MQVQLKGNKEMNKERTWFSEPDEGIIRADKMHQRVQLKDPKREAFPRFLQLQGVLAWAPYTAVSISKKRQTKISLFATSAFHTPK